MLIRRLAPLPRTLTSSLRIAFDHWLRRLAFGWRYGTFAARVTAAAAVLSLAVLVAASWQAAHAYRQAAILSSRLATLQSHRTEAVAAMQAAEPPDAILTLPSAPEVAQVMQTMQQAADKEGAQVVSLQAEDHATTTAALGHLDLTVAIKAPYPATMIVIQQVLDRYPGATLRQIQISHAELQPLVPRAGAAPPIDGAPAQAPANVSESHVTFAFWRRPLNVESAPPAVPGLQLSGAPVSPMTLSAAAPSDSARQTTPAASIARQGAVALPPLARAASSPK